MSERADILQTCVMRGRGGELFVSSSSSGRKDGRADLLVLSTAEPPRALVGLREIKPAAPGRERLLIGASSSERVVRIEGKGALACSIHLDNGSHVAGCKAQLPPGQGAEIRVEHDERAWRAFTYEKTPRGDPAAVASALAAGRFGALAATSTASLASAPLGTAVALAGNLVDRAVELPQASAVRIRATSGVCALVVGGKIVDAMGLGGGCDIVRVLPKGSHRVVVRAFGASPLSGNVNVSAEPVVALGEGMGSQSLVAAGDARMYRFTLAGDGEVGIGLQSDADNLECTLLDANQDAVGDGCHQFHRLKGGTYYLRVEAPDGEAPRRFTPVVFGLKGDVADVPESWLREFFARVGPQKESSR